MNRTTLRERVAIFMAGLQSEPMTPAHAWREQCIDAVVEFVCTEIGRNADKTLENTLPLVLYFGNDTDRNEFIAAIHEAKPNMTVRKI